MRVVWVSFAPLEKTPRGWTSQLASTRYRMLVPATAVGESRVMHLGPGANRRTLMERFRGADAVVLGKFFSGEAAPLLGIVARLRDAGVAVLADFSDDHFSSPALGDAYRSLADAVDRVVASTPNLAEVIARHSSTPVSVITDPVEGAQGEPRAPHGTPLRLLWFGHPTNLDTLRQALPQLRDLPCELTLITSPSAGAEQMGARFRPWSVQAVFDELRQCDAVLLPSNPHDPRKAVKSPNRFTESLWAGRFVIAHPLPAYQELADCGWVGEDIGEGAQWLAGHGEEAVQRVRRGQQIVAERFSPRAVGAAWQLAIERAVRR